jgi:hypothetical protein
MDCNLQVVVVLEVLDVGLVSRALGRLLIESERLAEENLCTGVGWLSVSWCELVWVHSLAKTSLIAQNQRCVSCPYTAGRAVQ